MRRNDLSHAVRQQLRRLPEPFAAHYGVLPPPPPEHSLTLGDLLPRHQAASEALARVDALATELQDPYLVSRVPSRREAVSSSAIEGTNSTLAELLAVEETGDGDASDAARQVRRRFTFEARHHPDRMGSRWGDATIS